MFKRRQLSYYTGNYEEYVTQVEERQLHQARQADAVERKREHTEKRWAGGVRGGACWLAADCWPALPGCKSCFAVLSVYMCNGGVASGSGSGSGSGLPAISIHTCHSLPTFCLPACLPACPPAASKKG